MGGEAPRSDPAHGQIIHEFLQRISREEGPQPVQQTLGIVAVLKAEAGEILPDVGGCQALLSVGLIKSESHLLMRHAKRRD